MKGEDTERRGEERAYEDGDASLSQVPPGKVGGHRARKRQEDLSLRASRRPNLIPHFCPSELRCYTLWQAPPGCGPLLWQPEGALTPVVREGICLPWDHSA